MRITEDRKGRLLETLWELNDRFQSGEDDEALGHMFAAITQFAEEAALDEREKVVSWLRSSPVGDEWADAQSLGLAKGVEQANHLK